MQQAENNSGNPKRDSFPVEKAAQWLEAPSLPPAARPRIELPSEHGIG